MTVSPLLYYRTFAAKDVFDVEEMITGFGHPQWDAMHAPARSTAAAVRRLQAAGAILSGKTVCDQFAFGLTGENPAYGTPVNPRAPDRVPGGSSAGSASVTASRVVDFAIGTDTGGSVRVPAAYCGIFGFRPTHGRVSMDGCLPLAPTLDTVGWFARSGDMLRRVGKVLLDDATVDVTPKRLLIATDAFEQADPDVVLTIQARIRVVEVALGLHSEGATMAPDGLELWLDVFRHVQGYEIWRSHGEWITEQEPAFTPGIARRMEWCRTIGSDEHASAEDDRRRIEERFETLLGDDAVLLLPTTPTVAPRRDRDRDSEDEETRTRTLSLTSGASLTGLPQVTIPAGIAEDAPVGLSLIAPRGADELLLELATRIEPR